MRKAACTFVCRPLLSCDVGSVFLEIDDYRKNLETFEDLFLGF